VKNPDEDGMPDERATLKRSRMLPTFRAAAQSIMAEINFQERKRKHTQPDGSA